MGQFPQTAKRSYRENEARWGIRASVSNGLTISTQKGDFPHKKSKLTKILVLHLHWEKSSLAVLASEWAKKDRMRIGNYK